MLAGLFLVAGLAKRLGLPGLSPLVSEFLVILSAFDYRQQPWRTQGAWPSELGYTGDTNNSASMNIWLHKQVMQKLAANGGNVPDDLKH